MKELLQELNITQNEARRILLGRKQAKPKVLEHHITDKSFAFGVVSDTHLCSTEEKLNELHTFYDICRKKGIKVVFHPGDLLSGWKIYKGQENEVKIFGAKNQAQYAIDNYPKVAGITTYFINGNHDESWYKLAGIDTGELIAKERPDMIYLGFHHATVTVNKINVCLHHGDGGGAYALSYKGQKFAEAIPSGKEKPRILLLGHYHTAFYFWYRNIHIINAGCFEGQTSFLARKMLNPALGGWIVELKVSGKPNDVLACKTCWIPFF